MNTTKIGCLCYGCLFPIGIVALLFLVLFIVDIFVPSNARRALPESASEVKESSSEAWNGDCMRLLVARLPENDFPKYANNLGLKEKYDPQIHGSVSLLHMHVGGVPWWNEPTELDNCYFKLGKDYIMRIKWKDGWVYFVECQT
jgi:hypothetical protein